MTDNGAPTRPDPRAGLESMKMPELKTLAAGLGVKGAGSLRKGPLVEAILATQGLGSKQGGQDQAPQAAAGKPSAAPEQPKDQQPKKQQPKEQQPKEQQPKSQEPKSQGGGQPKKGQPSGDQQTKDQPAKDPSKQSGANQGKQSGNQGGNQGNQGSQGSQGSDQAAQNDDGDDDGGNRRNRRRRGRDRNDRNRRGEPDLAVYEDDVLVPAAGILDVLDNYAFVRTSGYLPGVDDVYVSLSMVRKFGLRRGDAVVGQVRQPREGERKEKFNPLVKIEQVNGAEPDQTGTRPVYEDLTPVFADERIHLETDPEEKTGRVLDVVAPLGKGQRVLVLSPASGGRSTLLRRVAAALPQNHPECHLMVVLVDERPEEVTELQRTVRGEVIASTADRPATDHTMLAELAIERAKRLVELGHDVVVLFDGLSRLARAYNLAAPAGGRVLPGGLDTTAVLPVKQIFGSARNVEDGGSLTMLATAAVDNGSEADEMVLEEVRGAATGQVRLRRDLVESGVVPAFDLAQCWSLREELLMDAEEIDGLRRLRREAVAAGEASTTESARAASAMGSLLTRLGSRRTNVEVMRSLDRG